MEYSSSLVELATAASEQGRARGVRDAGARRDLRVHVTRVAGRDQVMSV